MKLRTVLWTIQAVTLCALITSSVLFAAEVEPDSDLVQMASKDLRDLNPVEKSIVRAAAHGRVAWGDLKQSSADDSENIYNLAQNAAYEIGGITKEARLARAQIIYWLLANPKARALLDSHGIQVVGVWIDGPLELSYLRGITVPIILLNCRIPDGVRARSAELSDLVLDGSWIGENRGAQVNTSHIALDAEGVKIHGNLLLSDGFESFGQVDLYAGQIDGELSGRYGTFSNLGDGQTALRLRLATIAGEAELRNFTTDGLIDAVGAKIGGTLNLDSAIFKPGSSNGLRAKSLTAHALDWTNITRNDTTELDLSRAKVAVFQDDKGSWPGAGLLTLNGFEYDEIERSESVDASPGEMGLAWLRLQKPYEPQPYKQLAKVFVEDGLDADAITVLAAKEGDMRRQAQEEAEESALQRHLLNLRHLIIAGVQMIARGILWLTIDYGYRPLRALWWIVGFVIAGTIAFFWGYQSRLIIPTDHEAYEVFSEKGTPPPDYQPFNSFVYSLETFVPLIVLHQANYWLPQPETRSPKHRSISGRMLRWYLWLHILLGWLFTSMLVAGLAGLIRNGQ